MLNLLVTFSTSALLVFLKFITESKFFFFILIILGCWSNIFVTIDSGSLNAFGSTALWFIKLGIFKLPATFEKQLLKIRKNSACSVTFLPSSVKLIFSLFEVFFFRKKRNYRFSERFIIINFAYVWIHRIWFLLALRSFLQQFHWTL